MLWNDTRAQSIQIGAVLLFGVLIILLSTWQAFGIPNQNEGIEFNHNQEVQQQMTDLRTTANSMPDASVTRSTTIDLGVRYPSRTIFRNPPPATGTIQTQDTDNREYGITISNAPLAEDNLANVWGERTGDETIGEYNTGALEYEPRYSEYQNPPRTIYEHSVVYNVFDLEGTTLSLSDQSIVSGDQINLIFLNGSLDDSRVDSTSVDFEPISTQTRSVRVEPERENGEADPIDLDIPTQLDVSEWEVLLGDNHLVRSLEEIEDETDPFADDDQIKTIRVSVDANRESGIRESYRLQLAKIGVGTNTAETQEEYITDGPNEIERITEGETERLRVEVRDEFNKPISGVTVTAQDEHDGLEQTSATTNDEGQAHFEYTAPSGVDSDRVELSFRNLADEDVEFDEDRPEDVAIPLEIRSSEDDDGTTTYGLSYVREDIQEQDGIRYEEDDERYVMNIGSNPDLITETTPAVQEAVVDFSLQQADQHAAFDGSGSDDDTDTDGRASVGIVADEAEDGDETIVHANSGGAGDQITVEFESGSFFDVTITSTNSPVVENGDLEVQFTVENIGDEAATQDLRLEFEGGQEDSETVVLEPGESETDTLVYEEVDDQPGEYEVAVLSDDDRDTETVNIITEDDPFFEVTIDEDESTLDVSEGETVELVADIFNSGADGDGDVDLIISDGVGEVDSEPVSLDADESEEVRLEWNTDEGDAGDFTGTVDADPGDSDETDVTVNEASGAIYDVEIVETNSPLFETEEIVVDAVVENVGESSEEDTITLNVESIGSASETVQLDGGESTTLQLSVQTSNGDTGEKEITVSSSSDSVTSSVMINENNPAIQYLEAVEGDGGNPDTVITYEVHSPSGDLQEVQFESFEDGTTITTESFDISGETVSDTVTIDGGRGNQSPDTVIATVYDTHGQEDTCTVTIGEETDC